MLRGHCGERDVMNTAMSLSAYKATLRRHCGERDAAAKHAIIDWLAAYS